MLSDQGRIQDLIFKWMGRGGGGAKYERETWSPYNGQIPRPARQGPRKLCGFLMLSKSYYLKHSHAKRI